MEEGLDEVILRGPVFLTGSESVSQISWDLDPVSVPGSGSGS